MTARAVRLVKEGLLTEERAARCPEEFRKIKKAWEHLLQPFMTNGAATNIDYKPSVPEQEAPKATKTDPWDTDSTPTPTTPQAPAQPATPPPANAHAITCEQVAKKALELIVAAAEDKAKTMTPEEVEELRRRLEAELPATGQTLMAQCAKDNWSDASRSCVIDATTLDAATKCN